MGSITWLTRPVAHTSGRRAGRTRSTATALESVRLHGIVPDAASVPATSAAAMPVRARPAAGSSRLPSRPRRRRAARSDRPAGSRRATAGKVPGVTRQAVLDHQPPIGGLPGSRRHVAAVFSPARAGPGRRRCRVAGSRSPGSVTSPQDAWSAGRASIVEDLSQEGVDAAGEEVDVEVSRDEAPAAGGTTRSLERFPPGARRPLPVVEHQRPEISSPPLA